MSLRNWMLFALAWALVSPSYLHALQTTKSWASAASELSHQIAGAALIAIAALVIAGRSSRKLGFLLSLWPLVFVALGLYLLVWSDPEIWPRGPFSWLWMIEHNAEARQHKLYALLLLALGTVEFLSARGKLTLRWQTWSFPVLAAFGALLLTLHSHSSGLPKGWHPSNVAPVSAGAAGPEVALLEPPARQDLARQESNVASNGHHSHGEAMSSVAAAPLPASDGHQQHQMSPKMQRIQRQHVWMAILGTMIAVFKFLADSRLLKSRAIPYIWPSAVAILGVLLMVYRE
jgi:hypothetical protein